MGAVPKRRISTGRKGRRRSAIKLRVPKLNSCPECNQPTRPHVACPNCGFYKGESVRKISHKETKKQQAPERKKKK
jgi:large subunit ribosomal protein L32